MSLLDGGIEAIFGAAFGAFYLDGLLHRDGTTPTYDGEGRITGYAGGADVPCKFQVDAASYSMRQGDGYTEGDVRLLILSAGLGVEVTTDFQVTARGQRWMLASVERDPANSHWICRGRAA